MDGVRDRSTRIRHSEPAGKWVSSFANDFNRDYHVSFTQEEMAAGKVNYTYGMVEFLSEEGPGLSVFQKNDAGGIFHTYSSDARGLDILVGAYEFLDLVPKGRDEPAVKAAECGSPTAVRVR
jgi:predicted dithiol-disulfide oxidoreductase (DUF899 family)